MPATEQPTLVGIDDMTFPKWADIDRRVAEAGLWQIAKLITGLYQPTGGQVCWDGHELAVLDQQSVQDQIAMVMQEPARWPMTADDNIRIGRIHRDDPDALAAAARESGADRVIGELPLGGKTVLSRRFTSGRDLSGGQWQRISVARGLYRDAPILVADEPTAAMDARAEDAVFRSLQKLSRTNESTRTTILITHRLANIRYADQIVVLDRGKIVELGTHTELMANLGTYAQLYELQAAAYAREPGVMVDSGQ
jgi:ATP-binding cassette subfamily B protein